MLHLKQSDFSYGLDFIYGGFLKSTLAELDVDKIFMTGYFIQYFLDKNRNLALEAITKVYQEFLADMSKAKTTSGTSAFDELKTRLYRARQDF